MLGGHPVDGVGPVKRQRLGLGWWTVAILWALLWATVMVAFLVLAWREVYQ